MKLSLLPIPTKTKGRAETKADDEEDEPGNDAPEAAEVADFDEFFAGEDDDGE